MMDNIRRACLLISRSNGGINRNRTQEQVLREMQKFLDLSPYRDELPGIDAWLGTLSPEDFETVCDGEMSEQDAILMTAPPFTNTLLNDYFEDVCQNGKVKHMALWHEVNSNTPRDRFIILWCREDDSYWWAKWQGGMWHGVDEHGITRDSENFTPDLWREIPRV